MSGYVRGGGSVDDSGQRPCARLDWCGARTVVVINGERVVTPAMTYRAYCDACETHIGERAGDLGPMYQRLGKAIGDPLQADVWVPVPFGPVVPLREDIDACMRLMAIMVGGWAARVRALPGLRLSAPEMPYDSPEGVAAAAKVLSRHVGPLLALQPGWTTRSFALQPDDTRLCGEDWLPSGRMLPQRPRHDPVPAEILEAYPDAEIIRAGVNYLDLPVLASGEDAGREILYLDYRGRRALLETNPPPELLIMPCRQCTRRELRRAWPGPGRPDLYSRCSRCGDEMTDAEWDVNAKRWMAFYQHRQTPAMAAAG